MESTLAVLPDSFARPSDFQLPGGEWFIGAGFGLFVHWDHASQQGIEISWPLVGRSIIPGSDAVEDTVSVEQYQSTAATFDPVEWDAVALARLAKRAGARYVVFTARHHAGYSMFHTEHSDFGIEHSPFGRDITREFVEAIRAEGIRVGIYYSLPDWNHPDYPAFEMSDRPYALEHWPSAGDPDYAGTPVADDRHRRPSPEQWAGSRSICAVSSREILTNYGTIDLLWFDGEWERSEAEWDSAGLRRLIKSLQPDVVINDRLLGQGDYKTPEQGFPVTAPTGPWELCMTIGQMWAWRPGRHQEQEHDLARDHADRGRRPRRQPAAQHRAQGRRKPQRLAGRDARRDRRVDGPARGERGRRLAHGRRRLLRPVDGSTGNACTCTS